MSGQSIGNFIFWWPKTYKKKPLSSADIKRKMASSKGIEKTLQKLRESVTAGNYYEAQQMYRTVARR